MASKKKTLREKAARHAKKYPEYVMREVELRVDRLVDNCISGFEYNPGYKEASKGDKYWIRRDTERLGEEVKDYVNAMLDEVLISQNIARIATDEAIQSNIEANMYKNMLGKDKKGPPAIVKIMKNSLYKRIKDDKVK